MSPRRSALCPLPSSSRHLLASFSVAPSSSVATASSSLVLPRPPSSSLVLRGCRLVLRSPCRRLSPPTSRCVASPRSPLCPQLALPRLASGSGGGGSGCGGANGSSGGGGRGGGGRGGSSSGSGNDCGAWLVGTRHGAHAGRGGGRTLRQDLRRSHWLLRISGQWLFFLSRPAAQLRAGPAPRRFTASGWAVPLGVPWAPPEWGGPRECGRVSGARN
eukprot:COSAG05_NODE_722_length_7764_cov_6.682322_2_plen_217_part_00